MEELVYLNGALLPKDQAKVSILDYGFLFGYGLYETIRAYKGQLFRLDAHLNRLDDSARKLGISLDLQKLKQGVLDTVQANGFIQTRVRITVSIGEGTMTPDLRSCQTPTVLILAGEYHPYSRQKYEQGFRVVVSSIRRNSLSPVTFMKSANTMECMLARQEARDAGADEALFFNEKGRLTEASGSNVFIVADGAVMTPRLQSGILPGVTRAALFELAKQTRVKISEANVLPQQLMAADEVFLTNSLIEVMPVTVVAGQKVGDARPGPTTRRLMEAYAQVVQAETL